MYTKEQVYEATLKYFNGDELATNVWIDKYCLKNKDIYYELTPEDMHWRLAKEFARIEAKYDNPMSSTEIFNYLDKFRYILPQGSPMAGIGNNFVKMSISNCLVIGNHIDSYGGIMRADEEQAQLMKRRCGVGNDISIYRPSGALGGGIPLGPNAGTTLYMKRFSNTTEEVQQDGRRGALMLSISIKHPDAEKFIDKKMTEGSVTGANVSVKISNDFMDALEKGIPFYQTFPIDLPWNNDGLISFGEADLNGEIEEGVLYPLHDGAYAKKIDPKKIWGKIVHNAWKSAEPGILFWDKTLNESPARFYGNKWKEQSTNPCGEVPLPANDSCRLLAINLASYVYNPFTPNAMLEDVLLVDHVKKAQRMMDDIVDLEIEKIDAIIEDILSKKVPYSFIRVELKLWQNIREMAVHGRRTGLGITGEADLIAAMGYTYGTAEATEFAEMLHQLIATAAYESSIELAEERGSFPMWESDKDIEASGFLKRMFWENDLMTSELRERYVKSGRRNIAILTIAPTGSLSLLTQTSSGIEPVFSVITFRKRKVEPGAPFDWTDKQGQNWEEYRIFHRPFIKWYAAYKEWTLGAAETTLNSCSKETLDAIFKNSPYYKATAQDVDYVEKVRMQGAVQKWVDHSISVTVNMPESVTEKIVGSVYKQAFLSGCKGITVYRDNSRGNVLSTKSIKETAEDNFEYLSSFKRPKIVECDVFFKSAAKDSFIAFVGKINGKPYEIFAIPHNDNTHISKRVTSGSLIKVKKGHYRFVSSCGKHTIDNLIDHMIENEQNSTRIFSGILRSRMDPRFLVYDIIYKYASISSFQKVIGKVLETYIEENFRDKCPDCGSKMIQSDGCKKCPECGHSACG